jgi:excisionase family DNA binding protein
MFGISRMSVRRAIDAGTISTFKIGRLVLVPAADIDRLTQPVAADQAA